jgi:hypothetical protein
MDKSNFSPNLCFSVLTSTTPHSFSLPTGRLAFHIQLFHPVFLRGASIVAVPASSPFPQALLVTSLPIFCGGSWQTSFPQSTSL